MVKPKIRHYIYYHCTKRVSPKCTQRSVEVTKLETQIKEHLESIEISDCFMDWALRQIHTDMEAERSFREDKIQSLRQTHDTCRTKLDNLLQLKISPLNSDGSLITDEQFKAQKQALEAELKGLETQLTEVDDRMVKAAQEIADKFDFVAHAKERFEAGDLAKKKEILSTLGSNLRLTDEKLEFDAPKYFLTLKEMKKEVPEISPAFEPEEKSVTKTKLEAFYASNLTVLRGEESNLLPSDYEPDVQPLHFPACLNFHILT